MTHARGWYRSSSHKIKFLILSIGMLMTGYRNVDYFLAKYCRVTTGRDLQDISCYSITLAQCREAFAVIIVPF